MYYSHWIACHMLRASQLWLLWHGALVHLFGFIALATIHCRALHRCCNGVAPDAFISTSIMPEAQPDCAGSEGHASLEQALLNEPDMTLVSYNRPFPSPGSMHVFFHSAWAGTAHALLHCLVPCMSYTQCLGRNGAGFFVRHLFYLSTSSRLIRQDLSNLLLRQCIQIMNHQP